jgi:putative CocE/NonD family hydrolase
MIVSRAIGASTVRYDDLGVQVVKNVLIPMSDGIRLAADLYAPLNFDFASGSQPLPVVMEYIPYRKDDVGRPGDDRWYVALPATGYIVARVDCRGTGGSEGSASDEYSPREQQDGAEAVEWLAGQAWCNSRVAMIGISYGGFTSLQVASLAPEHLAAIVPIDFTDDRFADDCHYVSGLLRMYHDVGYYGTFMVGFNAMPPDPAAADLSWADVWSGHLQANEPYLLTWLRNQEPGPYWENGSVGPIADRIACPVFMITGWHDGYTNPPLRLYDALSTPRRMLIGPWDHAVPNTGIPGPRIDYLPHVAAWLDQYCKTEAQAEPDGWPPVVVFIERYLPPDPNMLETAGEWRADSSWPVPGAHERSLYLEAGALADEPGAPQGTDELVYDPSVGVTTGLFSAGIPFNLPCDHRRDEAFSLNYTTPVLDSALSIIGRPTVVVHAATTARLCAVAATLCEVGPDGASRVVTKGIARLEPGDSGSHEVRVELNAVGWRFSSGNRIRLSIANADFPNVWPTPEPATTQVSRGGETPSRLILPAVPEAGSAIPPSFQPSSAPVTATSRTPTRTWEVTDNVLDNTTRVTCRFTNNGPRPFEFTCEVHRDSPADASVKGRFSMSKSVGGRSVSATADTAISSTSTAYHVIIGLTVRVDGSVVLTRQWVDSVPRRA